MSINSNAIPYNLFRTPPITVYNQDQESGQYYSVRTRTGFQNVLHIYLLFTTSTSYIWT